MPELVHSLALESLQMPLYCQKQLRYNRKLYGPAWIAHEDVGSPFPPL